MYWLIKKLDNGAPTAEDASDSSTEEGPPVEREEYEKDDLELADIPFPFRQRLPNEQDADNVEGSNDDSKKKKGKGKNSKRVQEDVGQIVDAESKLNLV